MLLLTLNRQPSPQLARLTPKHSGRSICGWASKAGGFFSSWYSVPLVPLLGADAGSCIRSAPD